MDRLLKREFGRIAVVVFSLLSIISRVRLSDRLNPSSVGDGHLNTFENEDNVDNT